MNYRDSNTVFGPPWDRYRRSAPLTLPRDKDLIPWPCTSEMLEWLAWVIHEVKKEEPWWRPLNLTESGYPEFLFRGLVGEALFAWRFGLKPDFSLKKGGDGGVDFILPATRKTVDVKTIKPGQDLLRETKKPRVDYIVAVEVQNIFHARFLGYIEDDLVRLTPARDTGCGVVNHLIALDFLKDLKDLEQEEGINPRGEYLFPLLGGCPLSRPYGKPGQPPTTTNSSTP